jgi:protein TonB
MILHAILVWSVAEWWQKTYRAIPSPSEIIEVEVVTRPAPAPESGPGAPTPAEPDRAVPFRSEPPTAPSVRTSEPTPVQPSVQADIPPPKQPAGLLEEPIVTDATILGEDTDHSNEAPIVSEQSNVKATERVSGPFVDRTDAVRRDYQRQIRELIERYKRYPLTARKGQQQGRVTVGFSLGSGGSLIDAEVIRSSGHRLLDRAALKAVRAVVRYPALPPSLQDGTRFEIDITFALE